MRFDPNPHAVRELLNDSKMQAAMEKVAQDGADQLKAALPKIVRRGGGGAYGNARKGSDGWYARLAVRSSFWHWPEYGHARYPATPYIRPTVQQLVSKYGGRWKALPK